MNFLNSLGIDWRILIAQIINFLLLLFVLTKLLYRPFLNMMEEEEKNLVMLKREKEELLKEKEKLEALTKQNLLKSKKASRKIIKEAEKIAEQLKEKVLEEAEKEKEAIIKQIKLRLKELNDEQKKYKKTKK